MKSLEFLKQMDELPRSRKFSLKRHHKICKRNQGKPHEFVHKKTSIWFWGGGKWVHYECRKCGKLEFTSSKIETVG